MKEGDSIDRDQPEPLRMTRAEYYAWTLAQPGRHERVGGEVVAMAPERVGHARVKAAVWVALRDAIAAAGLPCEAFVDGVTVPVPGQSDFEPDAVVECDGNTDDDAIAVREPIIVVEVLSTSTRQLDTGRKLDGYFSLPSVWHYLIVDPKRPMVVHHRRREDGDGIATRLVAGGALDLEPPGLRVDVARFYDRARGPVPKER